MIKRIFFGAVAGVIAGAAILLAVPVFNASAALNNFVITNYDIQYELSKNTENQSVLKTTEIITANFLQANVNRGIERAIPTSYNGHSTNLQIESVSKANGATWQYSKNTSNDVAVLRIGNPDIYVSGEQTYKIVYTQTNVTHFYADTDRDEWYWDTNGTEWKVPIQNLNISLKMSDDVAAARQGSPFCYQGRSGSSDRCEITQTATGEYTATATNLQPGENITLAFGFAPNTFAAYQPSLFERLYQIWIISIPVTAVIALVLCIWLTVQFFRKSNRTKELHTIPAQYIPQRGTSVTMAAQVITPKGSVFAAQLIDFAVRHYISIVETKPKGTWTLAQYDIVILKDPRELLEEEQEIILDMFVRQPSVGDRLSLANLKNNVPYYTRMQDNAKKIKYLVEGAYRLREKSKLASKFFNNWAIGILVVGVLTISLPLLFVAAIVAGFGNSLHPLTDKGLELRRYLFGLDKYISAAETERLKMLQGPETAERVGERVDTDNPGQILKLYERVLPYAILFGREKEWTKQLDGLYQNANAAPDWYSGSTAFNAGMLAGVVSSFATSASYSGGSSSDSGGSSGGGSSGGGGGGGGGGGW